MAFASKLRPLIRTQESKLLVAAPWGPTPMIQRQGKGVRNLSAVRQGKGVRNLSAEDAGKGVRNLSAEGLSANLDNGREGGKRCQEPFC